MGRSRNVSQTRARNTPAGCQITDASRYIVRSKPLCEQQARSRSARIGRDSTVAILPTLKRHLRFRSGAYQGGNTGSVSICPSIDESIWFDASTPEEAERESPLGFMRQLKPITGTKIKPLRSARCRTSKPSANEAAVSSNPPAARTTSLRNTAAPVRAQLSARRSRRSTWRGEKNLSRYEGLIGGLKPARLPRNQ